MLLELYEYCFLLIIFIIDECLIYWYFVLNIFLVYFGIIKFLINFMEFFFMLIKRERNRG